MRGRAAHGAVVVVLVGLLAGCGGASEQEQLVETLESDYDLGPEQAECVADQLYARFSDDEIDALRQADGSEDLPEDLLDDLRAALTPCAGS